MKDVVKWLVSITVSGVATGTLVWVCWNYYMFVALGSLSVLTAFLAVSLAYIIRDYLD